MPVEARSIFIELALAHGEPGIAFSALEDQGLDELPDWLVLGLADAAIAAPHKPFAPELLAWLRGRFVDEHPLTTAELYQASGNHGAARAWAARIAATKLDPSERARLAFLHQRLGQPEQALNLLAALHKTDELSPSAMLSLARLYLQLHRAEEGLRGLARGIDDRSLEAQSAWALVAAGAGRGESVRRWLVSNPIENIDDALLTDLFFIAERLADAPLALEASRRLHEKSPNDRNGRLYLARALIASGRHDDALVHLRTLVPGSPEPRPRLRRRADGRLETGAPRG